MTTDFFTCRCVFESDRTAPDRGIVHRIPIDCRDEDYWRSRSDYASSLSDVLNNPDELMKRYGEILELQADGRWYDRDGWRYHR